MPIKLKFCYRCKYEHEVSECNDFQTSWKCINFYKVIEEHDMNLDKGWVLYYQRAVDMLAFDFRLFKTNFSN